MCYPCQAGDYHAEGRTAGQTDPGSLGRLGLSFADGTSRIDSCVFRAREGVTLFCAPDLGREDRGVGVIPGLLLGRLVHLPWRLDDLRGARIPTTSVAWSCA